MKKMIIILLLIYGCNSYGQSYKDVDFPEFIRELQIWKKEDSRMCLAWWIPTEYWKVSFSQSNTVSAEVAEKLEDIVKNYVIICTGDLNFHGTELTYKSKEEIRPSLLLKDSSGKKYYPLNEHDISKDAAVVEQVIKPMFVKILGQMGQGIHIFYFTVKDSQGKNIIDPISKQVFEIIHSGNTFRWQLPLTSLLPPKFCPIDNVKMRGTWNYCPIHGAKL